jgi:hypothetical protein
LASAFFEGEAWSFDRGTGGELFLASSSTGDGDVFEELLKDEELVALLGNGGWEASESEGELKE